MDEGMLKDEEMLKKMLEDAREMNRHLAHGFIRQIATSLHQADVAQNKRIDSIERYLLMQAELKARR
jgi:oligoribonuclease (3'-5' exoribonuclease)